MFVNKLFPKRLTVGISVKGPLHVKKNIPNQDSFLCFKSFGFTLLVISDGLGSKKYSDFGSKMVCLAVKNICKQDFKLIKNIKQFDWDNFLSRAYLEWKKLIEKENYKINDCCATCSFAIIHKDNLYVASLGDGLIFIKPAMDKNTSVLLFDKSEEDFSNVTKCFCTENNISDWRREILNKEDFSDILLTTDGIASDLENDKIQDFCRDIILELQNKSAKKAKYFVKNILENWPVPKHSDDKTFVYAKL